MLPQLIALPVLGLIVSDRDIVTAAKYFVVVNAIGLICDWGSSSIGSKQLAVTASQSMTSTLTVFRGQQLVRLWVCAGVTLLACLGSCSLFKCGSWASLGLTNTVLCLGAIGTLWPHWAVIGTSDYIRAGKFLYLTRVVSLPALWFSVPVGVSIEIGLVGYYGIVLVATMIWASKIKGDFKAEGRVCERLSSLDFKPGLKVTIGGACSYCFLSTGVFVMDVFAPAAATAAFVLADRFVAVARALYAPVVQYLFAHLDDPSNGLMKARFQVVSGAMAFMVWLVGASILWMMFVNELALRLFSILCVGLVFLGVSHANVTFAVLGAGKTNRWLAIMCCGLVVYGLALWVFHGLIPVRSEYGVCMSVVLAEMSICVMGLLNRRLQPT